MTSSLKVILSSRDTLYPSSFAHYLSAFYLQNIGETRALSLVLFSLYFLLPRWYHVSPRDFCIHYKLWPPIFISISDLLCEVCTWLSSCPRYISFVKLRSPQIWRVLRRNDLFPPNTSFIILFLCNLRHHSSF